jgi:dolichyl-phosphate-mannose--protein O-mannosyl transferase
MSTVLNGELPLVVILIFIVKYTMTWHVPKQFDRVNLDIVNVNLDAVCVRSRVIIMISHAKKHALKIPPLNFQVSITRCDYLKSLLTNTYVVPKDFEYVTCGSTIKLIHEGSRFRLHSHDIAYGSGSGQQSVTAHGSRNDPNSYWIVKEPDSATPCAIGTKIKCGSVIRLEHASTRRNLHSHAIRAPLTSRHHEVSGYGVAGEGDSQDNWIVECQENQQCSAADQCEDDDNWKREELIRLRNQETGNYLFTFGDIRFDDSNCPRCPINGQQEVSATFDKSAKTLWFAGEGIYISPEV